MWKRTNGLTILSTAVGEMRFRKIHASSRGAAQVPSDRPANPGAAPNRIGEVVLVQRTIQADNTIRLSRRQFVKCFRYPVEKSCPDCSMRSGFVRNACSGRNGQIFKKRFGPLGAPLQGLFGGNRKQPGPVRPETTRDPRIRTISSPDRQSRDPHPGTPASNRRTGHTPLPCGQPAAGANAFFHKLRPRGRNSIIPARDRSQAWDREVRSEYARKAGASGLAKEDGIVSSSPSRLTSRRAWVLFPAPSTPSIVTKIIGRFQSLQNDLRIL